MANSYVPEVNDRVQCPNPKGGLSPYTGTVTQVYIGFVKVVFDKAQGPGGIHAFALTWCCCHAQQRLLTRWQSVMPRAMQYGRPTGR
jgi:hypothetical protein